MSSAEPGLLQRLMGQIIWMPLRVKTFHLHLLALLQLCRVRANLYASYNICMHKFYHKPTWRWVQSTKCVIGIFKSGYVWENLNLRCRFVHMWCLSFYLFILITQTDDHSRSFKECWCFLFFSVGKYSPHQSPLLLMNSHFKCLICFNTCLTFQWII